LEEEINKENNVIVHTS